MAKSIKTSKLYQEADPFEKLQNPQKSTKSTNTSVSKVKTSSPTETDIHGTDNSMKVIGKAIKKAHKQNVKDRKKADKEWAKRKKVRDKEKAKAKREKAREKAKAAKAKQKEKEKAAKAKAKAKERAKKAAASKKLSNVNDWARRTLEARGVSKKTSATLRKDYRKAFEGKNVNRLSNTSMRKIMMAYIQTQSTGITYKELAELLRHNIYNEQKDGYTNSRGLYYQLSELSELGEDLVQTENWESEVSAQDLNEILNRLEDSRTRSAGKNSTALRKALRIQLDMYMKDKGEVSDDVAATITEVSSSDYIEGHTRKKRK